MDTTRTVGRVFSGRYRLEEFLGGGGMAAVWRGRDLRLDRPVAIKELAGPWLRDPAAAARFDREARTAARLAHPNIVAVHDVGSDDDDQYLVMELIDGTTIAALLAHGPLPVDQAVAIAAQTCDGLAAAHAAGVIHRDIKPANLMITQAGVVKICDFGIAEALRGAADTDPTGSTLTMGTSRYMAPEQALGVHVNARTDLYALGCTIYAMLTGAAPFSGDDSEVVHKHLTTPPVPLREHRTDIPQPLADLVDQLLAKDPIDRPVDAAEVNARLMALPREPTTAVPIRAEVPIGRVQPVSEVQPEARPVTSPRRGLTPLIVALIALAAIVLLAIPAYLFLTSPSVSSQATRQPATDGAPTAPQLSPSPQPEPVVQPSASAKPSPSRSDRVPVRPTSEPAPVDPIVAMRLAIQQQVSTGNLNPDKAPDLYKKVDEIAREMNENDTTDAAKKAKELRDKLDDLLSQGQLSAGGHSTLIQRLDSITAALPEI